MNKRKGFTIVEIIVVMIVISILAYVGINANTRQISKSRLTSTAQTLEIIATDFDRIIEEEGLLGIAPTETRKNEIVLEFLSILEEEYLNFTFNRNTLKLSTNGAEIETAELKDGFEMPFLFYFSTAESDKRVMIISAGADQVFSKGQYVSGAFNDDVVLSIKERR